MKRIWEEKIQLSFQEPPEQISIGKNQLSAYPPSIYHTFEQRNEPSASLIYNVAESLPSSYTMIRSSINL